MNAKTPAQIAAMFGCTEEQAKAQIIATISNMRQMAQKAMSSKNGMYRGFSVEWYEDKIKSFSAVL